MRYLLKIYARNLLRFILHVLWIFPVKKSRIMFESNAGRIIGDNPFYIYEHLKEKETSYDFFWCRRKNTFIPENVTKTVVYRTFPYIFAMMTAKIIICDSGFPSYFPFRKKQVLIDTWHGGGAYKKVGATDKAYEEIFRREDLYTTYFLSSSRKFSDVMTKSRFISIEKYLRIGMPRNDIFFNSNKINITNLRCRNLLEISQDAFVILYAPTFRGMFSDAEFFDTHIDVEKIKDIVSKKFNKKVMFILRAHPDVDLKGKDCFSGFDLDVSKYPYMQELLCAADMLITDYSSSMWDFSFTNKPGFLFVPDLDKYQAERGLYTSIETWPFMYAKTNEELSRNIQSWSEEFQIEKNCEHHKFLESYEDGHAAEKVCKVIEENLF